MSTKTTLKRIALVAVSALGFGLVSGVPVNAAAGTGSATNYTSSLTLGWSALTVVDSDTTDNNGFFYVDSTNTKVPAAAATSPTAIELQTGESIRVFVSGAPTGRAVTDLNINSVKNSGALPGTAFAATAVTGDNDEDVTVQDDTVTNMSDAASPNNSFSTTAALNNEGNRYWFAINTDTASAIGAGKYTITIRLTNANSQVIDYTMTVKFVSTIADAGAVLTLAKTGSITKSATFSANANQSVRATLRDADGGRIQVGQALTGSRDLWDPALNAALTDADGVVGADSLTVTDNGVNGEDYVECGVANGSTACGTTPSGGISQAVSQASLATGDGVYGVKAASAIAADASSTSQVRIRVTGTSVSASITVPVIVATTAPLSGSTVLLDATGISAANKEARTPTITSGVGSITYSLPVSATTAKLTVDTTGTVAGEALTATTTWSGNYATSNVTPASANVATVFTDASGKLVLNLTNSAPVAGGTASVKITGFATTTDSLTITLNWVAAAVDSVTVLDPVADVYVKTKSSTVFTIEVDDQFGNPMAGEQVTPSLSSTSANYSATTTYAPVTTNAKGIATWTLTDAAATDTVGDSITFTTVNGGKTASYSLTYKATLPAASTLTGFSSSTQSAAATVAARGTSISAAAGLTGSLVIARNLSKDLSAFTDGSSDDMYAIRIRAVTSTGAAATGAAVTLTAPTGGWVQDVSGLPATSRTVAANADGDAYFRILATATGKLTFTATSGTATFSFPVTIADQSNAAARFVTMTGATTGAANGAGVPMTVAVTDRYGNGVANVTLVVTASGAGAFLGGQTSQSFTTDATGKYTFLATSYADAGGSATYSANATNATDADSIAGYSSTTVIDSTVAAGKKSATATVTFSAGVSASQSAAEAATDAAAEAIDAANAATDAANLAAEAADAATVAAEEARDAADAATAAVEELATQVATLMAALKAQITTLANTVAKIAKKVKA